MPDLHKDVSRRHLVIGGAIGALVAAAPALAQTTKPTKVDPAVAEENPQSVAALKILFDSYFKAFSAHDAAAVVALFAPNAVIIGTGPGEIWGGPEEIAEAHKRFFQGFDPGKQESEVLFREGNIIGDMAWLMSISRVKFTKGADVTEFGLNSTAVFERIGGRWLIRLMHFSNLTAAAAAAKS